MTVRREIALEYIRTSDDPCTDRSGRFSYSAIRSLSPLLAVSKLQPARTVEVLH